MQALNIQILVTKLQATQKPESKTQTPDLSFAFADPSLSSVFAQVYLGLHADSTAPGGEVYTDSRRI
jgi:hypothetical protein